MEVPHLQVSKWGNSLAVRLPAAVIETLGPREGDEITIEVSEPHHFTSHAMAVAMRR